VELEVLPMTGIREMEDLLGTEIMTEELGTSISLEQSSWILIWRTYRWWKSCRKSFSSGQVC
jgi:hypothetical protein